MSLCAKNHKTFLSCPYDPLQCSEIEFWDGAFFWVLVWSSSNGDTFGCRFGVCFQTSVEPGSRRTFHMTFDVLDRLLWQILFALQKLWKEYRPLLKCIQEVTTHVEKILCINVYITTAYIIVGNRKTTEIYTNKRRLHYTVVCSWEESYNESDVF